MRIPLLAKFFEKEGQERSSLELIGEGLYFGDHHYFERLKFFSPKFSEEDFLFLITKTGLKGLNTAYKAYLEGEKRGSSVSS